MFDRFRRFLIIPACLLVAAPVVTFTVTAEPDSRDTPYPEFTILSFEESIRLFGWAEYKVPTLQTIEPVKLPVVPHVFSYIPLRSSLAARPLLSTFRGLTGRNKGTWRFDQVLARHEIELKSDPLETVNITLAAEAVDGTVIMPGAIFSFNEQVGIRSEEKGYKPGLMFQQGQVIRGIGGGICTISTGIYNAALKAGLKIVDRCNHSGVPRYAEPGLDAAVVYGSMDLKFKNDTPTPVLLRAYVDEDILKVTLLGRKRPGIEVELAVVDHKEIPYKVFEKPDPSIPEGEVEVKQTAKPGLEVTTVRIIRKDGKVIKREIVGRSCYLPRHKVVLVPVPPEDDQAAKDQEQVKVKDKQTQNEAEPNGPPPAAPAVKKTAVDEKKPVVKKWEVTSEDPDPTATPDPVIRKDKPEEAQTTPEEKPILHNF